MPADDRPIINPMELEPFIKAGAEARASTAAIWSELRGFVESEGKRIGPDAWQVVNGLRSVYAAQRNGTERFLRAPGTAVFDARMAAPELNMRPAEVRAIMPEYMVRIRLEGTDDNGDPVVRHATMKDTWRPGMTVGEVLEATAEAAEGLAEEYGFTYTGHSIVNVVSI